jgi:hypothetical protein
MLLYIHGVSIVVYLHAAGFLMVIPYEIISDTVPS